MTATQLLGIGAFPYHPHGQGDGGVEPRRRLEQDAQALALFVASTNSTVGPAVGDGFAVEKRPRSDAVADDS